MAANDGQIPVRTLAQAARLIREARQLRRYGIDGSREPIRGGTAHSRKRGRRDVRRGRRRLHGERHRVPPRGVRRGRDGGIGSADPFDDLDQLVEPVAVAAREPDEVSRALDDRLARPVRSASSAIAASSRLSPSTCDSSSSANLSPGPVREQLLSAGSPPTAIAPGTLPEHRPGSIDDARPGARERVDRLEVTRPLEGHDTASSPGTRAAST